MFGVSRGAANASPVDQVARAEVQPVALGSKARVRFAAHPSSVAAALRRRRSKHELQFSAGEHEPVSLVEGDGPIPAGVWWRCDFDAPPTARFSLRANGREQLSADCSSAIAWIDVKFRDDAVASTGVRRDGLRQ